MMEVSEAKNSPDNLEGELDQVNSPDESGIVADMSLCNKTIDFMDTSQTQSTIDSSDSQNSTTDRNSLSSGIRDDSGIYSDKSSASLCTREISDPDISESVSEGIVEVNDVDEMRADDVKDDILKINENINMPKLDTKDSEAEMLDKNVDNAETVPEAPKDKIITDHDETDSESIVNNNSKLSSDIFDDDNNCDNAEFSQREDETWAKYVEKIIDAKKVNSGLVDYEDSDSDSNVKLERRNSSRQYRKRRVDSDSDDDSDHQANDNGGSASADSAANDGTPVLIRHSALENAEHNTRSPMNSDSESDENVQPEMSSSSESESDDAPMDFTPFGPPKHKWRSLFDLRQREFGYPNKTEPAFFRKKVQGSLQMVQRFELQYKMENHEGCVNALCFNSSGNLLASGSDDLKIVIWDWLKNRPALVYDSGHRSNVFQSKFMPLCGDCHVVSCARDGQVRLADISQTGVCKGTKKLAQHKGAAHKLAVEVDSPHTILSCGEDAVTYEIDLRADKPNKLVTSKENGKAVAMYSIHSNPGNQNEFCLSGRDHFIRVYDKRKIDVEVNNGVLKKFAPHHIASCEKADMKANVTCACYNYNGTELLGTYNDEDIYLFSNEHSDEADYIHKYKGHRNNQTVKGVNFYGPRSEFVVSGSDCGHIFLWDKATENIVQFMEGDEGGVINVLEPHPFAPILATSGLDHDVKIWAPTAETPTTLKGLKKLTKRNVKEREDERSSDRGMIDGSMLWFIMHQLRRNRRQRERERRGENVDDDSSDTVSDDEEGTMSEESDSEEGGDRPNLPQCNPS